MNKLHERLEREKEWHNKRFANDFRPKKTKRFYASLENWYTDYIDYVFNNEHAHALEIGAGLETVCVKGIIKSSLVSIDISETSIQQLHELEIPNKKVKFEVADVHDLNYENSSFDLIIGRGILHHLDLQIALGELNRVLKDGGRVCFGEPLSGNLLIKLFRLFTPNLRTPDEKPLSQNDIQLIRDSFPNTIIVYYGFLTLCLVFLKIPQNNLIRNLDNFLLNKLKLGRYLAWTCLIKSNI